MDSKACHVNYFIIVYVTHLLNKMSLFQRSGCVCVKTSSLQLVRSALGDVTPQWRCPWCWSPITWRPIWPMKRALPPPRCRFSLFMSRHKQKTLRLRFLLRDTSIVIIVLCCDDSRLGSGRDWWWTTTTRPAWKTLFTASWNISVRRSKRPTASWKRTWRPLEMIDFTGGWGATWSCDWVNYCSLPFHSLLMTQQNYILQIILLIQKDNSPTENILCL